MKKILMSVLIVSLVVVVGCEKKQAAPASGQAAQAAERPAVVNTKCPIMGDEIDPNNVPDSLYREFKGQGVGFCCGACPPKWDELTDAEKAGKLAASK